MVREGGPDPSAKLSYGFRRVTSRRPAPPEVERLLAYYNQQLARFQKDSKTAGEVAKDYKGPAANIPEVAAWTMLSNVILNLDETITKE